MVDVGCAAYGQLQKMKGQEIDSADGADKKTFEPKPTRLLHLTLTDGVSEVMAMEYMPIPQLKINTTPGAKVWTNLFVTMATFLLAVLRVSLPSYYMLCGLVSEEYTTEW